MTQTLTRGRGRGKGTIISHTSNIIIQISMSVAIKQTVVVNFATTPSDHTAVVALLATF